MLTGLIVGLGNAYSTIIFIYVVLSWFPHDHGFLGDAYNVLGKLCDPFLDLFKRLIPPIGGMVDVTPIIALLVLQFVIYLIVRIL